MSRHAPATILLIITLLTGSGCGLFKDEKAYTPTEAEKKLAAFCLKEGNIAAFTRRADATLWVYIPIREPIFKVKSTDNTDTRRKVQPFSVLSVQSEFSEDYFKFNYDIIRDVLSPEPQSYGSDYNEKYTKKRQLVYYAIKDTFFNVKPTPEDPLPEFVVIMIADITTGIATKSTIYLNDLKKYLTEALPPDEYFLREVNEIIGRQALIDDEHGEHAPYAAITWPSFLMRQIENRIKYKFTSSNLSKDAEPRQVIAVIVAGTLRFYPFKDFNGVLLYDVRTRDEFNLTGDLLKEYETIAQREDPKGKYTTIRFKIPEDPASGAIVDSVTVADEERPDPENPAQGTPSQP